MKKQIQLQLTSEPYAKPPYIEFCANHDGNGGDADGICFFLRMTVAEAADLSRRLALEVEHCRRTKKCRSGQQRMNELARHRRAIERGA